MYMCVAMCGSMHGVATRVTGAATMPSTEKIQLLEDISTNATNCRMHLVRSTIHTHNLVQNLTRLCGIATDDEGARGRLNTVRLLEVGSRTRQVKRRMQAVDEQRRRISHPSVWDCTDPPHSDTERADTSIGSTCTASPPAQSTDSGDADAHDTRPITS